MHHARVQWGYCRQTFAIEHPKNPILDFQTERTTTALSTNVDKFAQCRYLSHMSNRWLATRLELLGNTCVLFASLSATLSTKYFGLTPGMAGLSVSYALTITEVLNICVRSVSEIESNIVSVERVNEYQKLEPEAPWRIEKSLENEEKWPVKGKIELDGFSMRYRKNLPLVLKNIDLKIEGGERIGVIGRTGSGKSSLTMALYRYVLEQAKAGRHKGRHVGMIKPVYLHICVRTYLQNYLYLSACSPA